MILSLCEQHDLLARLKIPADLIRRWIDDCEDCSVILDND